MWQGSFRLAGRLVALALPLIASTASAAQLIPVLVDPSQNLITPGTAGQIGNALLYDRGVSTTGEPGPWPLGDYRMSISTASATMSASFEAQGLRMSTSASLRDEVMGDLRAPEANPQIGDTWFYVAAEAGEVLGEMVDFHLSLRWDSMATGGATIDSTATALLSNATNPRVARALTRKNDNVEAEVMIGEVYRVGLYHNNLVRDGLLVSSATLYAGLDTPPAMATPAPILAGDYNLDGIVNAADYTVWRDGLIKPYDFDLDGDGSGVIDAGDRDVFNAWYGTTVPGVNAVAIPEPATAVFFLAGLAVCRPRRN